MQEVDGIGRAGAGGQYGFTVRAKHGGPTGDILRMLQASWNLQLRAQEGRGEFGDEFLEGVGLITEAFAEFACEAIRGAYPVGIMPVWA